MFTLAAGIAGNSAGLRPKATKNVIILLLFLTAASNQHFDENRKFRQHLALTQFMNVPLGLAARSEQSTNGLGGFTARSSGIER